MLVNFSSHPNNSLLLAPNSSSLNCFTSPPNSFLFSAFNATKILLLLPLCTFILSCGFQQWWQDPPTSSPTTSHSDSFTYHLATMEIIGVVGCFFSLYCCYSGRTNVLHVGLVLTSFTSSGEVLFHVLASVERYLAVVQPITYVSLRAQRGIRIRSVITGLVWLLCCAVTCLHMDSGEYLFFIANFLILILSLTTVSFCSVSVLRALIRPGPGEQGGIRVRVDPSKQRAFYMIAVILGMLVLGFVVDLVWSVLYFSGEDATCVLVICGFWVDVPRSLVLPLLFIFTKKKLKRKLICYNCCRD